MSRLDVISPRPRRDGKTYWHKVGAAFPRDKGGFSVTLDSLPLPDAEGRVTLLMTEPKPRDGNQAGPGTGQSDSYGGYGAGGQPSSGGDIDQDSIPFTYEWRG